MLCPRTVPQGLFPFRCPHRIWRVQDPQTGKIQLLEVLSSLSRMSHIKSWCTQFIRFVAFVNSLVERTSRSLHSAVLLCFAYHWYKTTVEGSPCNRLKQTVEIRASDLVLKKPFRDRSHSQWDPHVHFQKSDDILSLCLFFLSESKFPFLGIYVSSFCRCV